MAENRSSSSPLGGTKLIRVLIMTLIIVISLGYLMMWIMFPTSIGSEKWYPKIVAKTNSTYFGYEGINIMMFSFPPLVIAVLGCGYLHLGEKLCESNTKSNINKKKRQLSIMWKKPMIIKGLGIVSLIELAFLAMFIALLVWYFSAYLRYFFANITKPSMPGEDKVWEAKFERVALNLGLAGNLCLVFLFYPVSRNSSVLPLLGLTSEASIKYHIWIGHIAMVLFTAHGVLFISYWAATHRLSEMLKWSNAGVSNLAGELSLLSGLVLWVTTYPSLRRKTFELFFYTHHLYILFIVFFIFHLDITFACIMLPGFYLFLVDRYLRFLQSRQKAPLISARILPSETIELNFSKSPGLRYTPTSIMFINVPIISKLQWHPFTISSSSNFEVDTLSIIIKRQGSWSNKLYHLLSTPSSIESLSVSVEGPYGPASTHFLRHDTLVMVSGGSGISPFISIIRELIFISSTLKCNTPKVLLISAFKKSSDLTMLDLLLPISSTPSSSGSGSGFSNLELQIEAYVTRDEGPSPAENKNKLQILWFKTNMHDSPISPILGKNSWLWLGAIISSSFIVFLLFMGILTRYYIYPIDHNSSMIYSHSLRSMLNILLICISIATTASAAFLWNKKQNSAMETKPAEDMERSTPISSSIHSWLDADRELESLTNQTIFKPTKVYYGQRPDLKRILLECKGSSIGVLVCGPKQMRHDVATICSSGLADNLHFESISFNW